MSVGVCSFFMSEERIDTILIRWLFAGLHQGESPHCDSARNLFERRRVSDGDGSIECPSKGRLAMRRRPE